MVQRNPVPVPRQSYVLIDTEQTVCLTKRGTFKQTRPRPLQRAVGTYTGSSIFPVVSQLWQEGGKIEKKRKRKAASLNHHSAGRRPWTS